MNKYIHTNSILMQDNESVQSNKPDTDRELSAEIINRYFNPVYHMILKLTGSENVAEQVTRDTFRQYFTLRKHAIQNDKSDVNLFKLAIKVSIDFLLQSPKIMNMDNVEKNKPESFDPEIKDNSTNEFEIEHLEMELLDEILRKLKPSYSRVLELKYLKNYSLEEIAKELQLSSVSIRSKLFHGKKLVHDLVRKTVAVN